MNRKKIIWNMLGSLVNALSSMILLIIVNRVNNPYNGGLFSLGFATAQMMSTIGTLEVRNYQSSDVKEEFDFNDYYSFRIITCIFMMLFSFIYVVYNGYALDKMIITLLLCFYKMVEAYSDVFEGYFQLKGRIDYSGKSMFFRVILSTFVFITTLIVCNNLYISIFLMFISSLFFAILYNRDIIIKNWRVYKFVFNIDKWKRLTIECLPLAIGAFIILYTGNAPKYAVDKYMGVELQNIFSILFMPAFIINLFSLFAFRPMLTNLAIKWERCELRGFFKILFKSYIWLFFITIICLGGAYLLGIEILSLLYGIDLGGYRLELILIMIGGSLNAFSTILRFTLTVVREQLKSIYSYIITLIVTLLICPYLVKNYLLLGACMSYIFSMIVLSIGFIIILYKAIRKKRKCRE